MAVTKGLPEHEHRPLDRRQSLHQHEQGQRHRFTLFGKLQRTENPVCGEYRFRQPRTEVMLAPGAGAAQPVQAQVGDHLGQPGRGHDDHRAISGVPPQERLLNHILRVLGGAEQPVREPERA